MRRWVSSPGYKAVVSIVTDARLSAGFSQRELARRLGKPPSFVAKVELKERRIDVVEFLMILRALGADECAAFEQLRSAIDPSAE